MNAVSQAEAPIAIEGDGVELRMQKLGGGMTAAFVRVSEGADFRPALAGLPDDLCQCPHWGYLLEGRLKMRTRNDEQLYEAGQAFYWAPGHAPEVGSRPDLRARAGISYRAEPALTGCDRLPPARACVVRV